MKILMLIMLFVMNAVANNSENIPLYKKLEISEGDQFLLIAFQESGFIRHKIGEWLPKSMMEIPSDAELYYSVTKLEKIESYVNIEIDILNVTNGRARTLSWRWKLAKDYENILVSMEEPNTVQVKYGSGEIRKIVLDVKPSVDEFKASYSISKGSPLWEWAFTQL